MLIHKHHIVHFHASVVLIHSRYIAGYMYYVPYFKIFQIIGENIVRIYDQSIVLINAFQVDHIFIVV